MKITKYSELSWEESSYSGIRFSENHQDHSGDRLRYFNLSKGSIIPNHNHMGYEKIIILNGRVKFLDAELTIGDILLRI